MMEDWHKVCELEEIPRLGARVVKGNSCDIALFRDAGDKIYALHDRCPHKGGPLSQGIVSNGRVVCPLHGMTIDLEDGKAVSPDEGCAERFRVKIDQGTVYLLL